MVGMAKRISRLTIKQVQELATQGKPIRKISAILGLSRNTVRRYLREEAPAIVAEEQIAHWSVILYSSRS